MQRKQLKVLRAGFMGSVFDLACVVESFACRAHRRRIGGNNDFQPIKIFALEEVVLSLTRSWGFENIDGILPPSSPAKLFVCVI